MAYNPHSAADRTALADRLMAMFERSGFTKMPPSAFGGEDIYEYKFKSLKSTSIMVYSSIVNGMVRGDGEDAIRVSAIYTRQDGKVRGLFSDTRVNRTGEVDKIVERTLGRMRSAFTALKGRCTEGKTCSKCGAPLFMSKAKNEVCAETCWANKVAA